MISPEWCRYMARYNRWQNQLVLQALTELEEPALRRLMLGPSGAALSVGLVQDLGWLRRLSSTGGGLHPALAEELARVDFSAWRRERQDCDARLITWSQSLLRVEAEGMLFWHCPTRGEVVSRAFGLSVTQMFLSGQDVRRDVWAALGGKAPPEFLCLPDDADWM